MCSSKIRFLLLLFLCCTGFSGMLAQIKVSGHIFSEDGQPIHFATILLQGTRTGTITDNTGFFSVESDQKVDSVVISAVGYHKQVIPLSSENMVLSLALKESIYELHEVKVEPGENPAHPIIRNIIEHKKQNNPANFGSYSNSVYNKIEIDIKNVNKPERDRRIWREVGFVFDHLDSTELENTPFLPVFLTETLSEFHYSERENKTRELILANKISGVNSTAITRFTGSFYQDFNIYQNYINVENIGLISPVNDQALLFYKFHLIDSIDSHPHKLYRIDFIPRVSQDPAFSGSMWVADSVFALHKIHLDINQSVNINFLNDLKIRKSFAFDGKQYVPSREEIYADFDIEGNRKNRTIGLIARKTTVYKDFEFGEPAAEILANEVQTKVNDNALSFGDDYWEVSRPEKLNKREETIYYMVDSLQNLPAFKRATAFFETLFFGYKDLGPVEIGPYYYMYSYNPIEGNRIRLGGRTTKQFSERFRLDGYAAWGFQDKQLKYSLGTYYYFNKEPFRRLSLQYEHDYQLLGKSQNAFMEDNFLNAAMSLNPNDKLTMTDKLDLDYIHEWREGFSNHLNVRLQRIQQGPFLPFYTPDSIHVPSIQNAEIGINTRLAHGESHIAGDFERISMGSKSPIVNVYGGLGLVELNSKSNYYARLSFDLYDKIPLNPLGYSFVFIQGGAIFGSVPFPLLKLHEGNETLVNDLYAFNLMDYYEFASDTYASAIIEHHFQGFFLNKIPLLKYLKLREVIGAKAVYGTLDPNRHQQLLLTQGLSDLKNRPYLEASAGVENVLRFFRVDAVWRLSHREQLGAQNKFGVRVSLHVRF